MQILNIVHFYAGAITSIESFPSDYLEGSKDMQDALDKASDRFIEIAKGWGFKPFEDYTEEDLLEDGHYGQGDYEVILKWSEKVTL